MAICSYSVLRLNKVKPKCEDFIGYRIEYFVDGPNMNNFLIDPNNGRVYFTPMIDNFSQKMLQSKYLVILTAFYRDDNNNNFLKRLENSKQVNVTFNIIGSKVNRHCMFESSYYNLQILDTAPVGTLILTIPIRTNTTTGQFVDFIIEQMSNLQIYNYFEIGYSPATQSINIRVKYSPIPIDKPNIRFVIRLKDDNSATTEVNIKVIPSNTELASYLNFNSPAIVHQTVILKTINGLLQNNTIVYQLSAESNNAVNFEFRIIKNELKSPFYVDEMNRIRFIQNVNDELVERPSYLVK
jgi:hypothetical protein